MNRVIFCKNGRAKHSEDVDECLYKWPVGRKGVHAYDELVHKYQYTHFLPPSWKLNSVVLKTDNVGRMPWPQKEGDTNYFSGLEW